MVDPVVASDGHTYEREAIEGWLHERGKRTSPMTGLPLESLQLLPNRVIKSAALEWQEQHPSSDE